jgi:plasmid stabilization system protein ParE
MYEVLFTKQAIIELDESHTWWATHRSPEQADRWHSGFLKKLLTLEENPERYPFAPESAKFHLKIHQINYGLGRKPTHRALYIIRERNVLILRIRHFSQDDLAELL